MSILFVAFAQSAFATNPHCPPPAVAGTCDPSVASTYEMSDFDGHRTIWAPNLVCAGEIARLTALPGAVLQMNPAPGPANHPNPGGQGSFSGQFELVTGADCAYPRAAIGSVWDVTYDVLPPAANTGPKNTLNDEDAYQLGIADNGVMTHGSLEVTFTNKPADLSMGHQIGMGANDKEANDLGGAFWFFWDLYDGGSWQAAGMGDFNFDLTCMGAPSCPTDGGLGVDGFGVYVCGDFVGHGSDSQGAMAIGGDAELSGYGVASSSDNGAGIGLTVGGELDATSGQVYHGDVEAGTCSTSQSFNVLNGVEQCGVSDAGADCTDTCLVSDYIAGKAVRDCTVTATPWGHVNISVSGSDAVCELDTDAIAAAFQPWVWNGWINGITIDGMGNHPSTVIVNVTGSSDIWGHNGQTSLVGVSADAVVWNLGCGNDLCDDANPLSISNVGVKGSLMAPDCAVDFTNGHIDGQYVVGSHDGNGQFHDYLFTGDICL